MTLPTHWRWTTLRDVLTSTEYGSSAPTHDDGTRRIVGMTNLINGRVVLGALGKVNEDAQDWTNLELREGDILLNRTNSPALVGKVGIVRENTDAIFASYLVRLNSHRGKVDPFFLNYWLNGDVAQGVVKRVATRGVSQANINPTVFQDQCPVPVPPLAEQRKIAEILRTWDDAIDRAAQALAACRRQMDVLRGRVFRTSRGNAHWAKRALGEIATQVRTRSNGGAHPVMTISAKSGFVLQSDKYSREMAGESLKTYTLLHEGDFAYNKGNSLIYPQGCIFPLKEPTALVPSVYFSFRLDSSLNPTFYEHYFAAGSLNRQLGQIISSGVRGNGLLNVTAHDFFKCVVPVPPRAEQDLIASVLSEVSLEIGLLSRKVEALRTQKRGLMQKLLTGEIRVGGEG